MNAVFGGYRRQAMARIPEFRTVQLNAIERKFILKMAEDSYKGTNFSKDEVVLLMNKYRSQASPGKMDRGMFRDVLHMYFHMSDDFFMDRVFRSFDRDSDGYLSLEEWVRGLSIFLRGTLDQKITFSFAIYDLNDDGYISREEIYQLLKSTLVKSTEEDPEEGIKEMVEAMLKKMDKDGDGKVSLQDFLQTIRTETLLIEAFGPCLPCTEDTEAFSEIMFDTEAS